MIALIAALILAFVVRTGALTLPLIVGALLLAWFYSAPPIRLHSRGLGELTVAVLVPGLVPLTGYYLQRGRLDPLPLLAAFPLACFQFAMLLSIEFPDAVGDQAAGKRTLVVRLGANRAARLYVGALAVAYLALPLLVIAGLPLLTALALLLISPLALWLMWRFWRGDYRLPQRWNPLAFFSIALLTGSAALEAFTFALLIGMRS